MKRIAALAIGGLLAAPAFAGGPVRVASEPAVAPAPAPVVAAPTVDWTGFYAGGQLGYADLDSNINGYDGNGAIGGVHAGYRYDLGKAVIGAELAYDVANVDIGDGNDSLDNATTLKLIAGGKIDRGLLYATVGSSWADVTVGGQDYSDNGYVFGVGYDYALNDRWTVGGEILRHNYDDVNDAGTDLDATTLQVKAAYRF